MFPFSSKPAGSEPDKQDPVLPSSPPVAASHPLDEMTGGVFSATTSAERVERVQAWLETDPGPEQMQSVFKALSDKDKGAARLLRDKLDVLRENNNQQALLADWQARAQALLAADRLNIADALAWQRDAAKAGAPLATEPLAGLRAQLADRVKLVEDLQQQVMVQREAAAMLAQRIDWLTTQPWQQATEQQKGLEADVTRWHEQMTALQAEPHWPSVDLRYPAQLDEARSRLDVVWQAFVPVLEQTQKAAEDVNLPLPSVPFWADELKAARRPEGAAADGAAAKKAVDPERQAAAVKTVAAGVMLLEQAVTAGHTKNMNSAVQALRQSLKAHGRLIDDALEARVHAALVSAGQLEGWQRWSADKIREQLVARAEALLVRPEGQEVAQDESSVAETTGQSDGQTSPSKAQPTIEGEGEGESTQMFRQNGMAPDRPETNGVAATPGHESEISEIESDRAAKTAKISDDAHAQAAEVPEPTGVERRPTMSGRKLQEAIRKLRDEWKTADQGGPPNHGLWKRFDRACNAAYQHVEAWLVQVRAEAAKHEAERRVLIDEVHAWAQMQQDESSGGQAPDWKTISHRLRDFSQRWRRAGHVPEKMFAKLQTDWKTAFSAASAPLEAEQKTSLTRRKAMIAEAEAIGAADELHIDAIKDVQQRWQAEARTVPLERKREQKLWDAFRKPIDAAFKRKDNVRAKQRAAMSAHDRAVLEAVKALEAANQSGDAEQIRVAMAQLEQAMRAQATPAQPVADQSPAEPQKIDAAAEPAAEPEGKAHQEVSDPELTAPAEHAASQTDEPPAAESTESAAESPPAPQTPVKPVVAMRGDDRPGGRGASRQSDDRTSSRDGRRDGRRSGDRGDRNGRDDRRGRNDRGGRGQVDRGRTGPRLGDAAFRAQRGAMDDAQAALRKLAAQAHGEAVVELMDAWQQRAPAQVPEARALGKRLNAAARADWSQAIEQAGGDEQGAQTALLRLELAAEVPTPADQLDARRALQLQLLTQRNDPSPAETWADDVTRVLTAHHDAARAQRLRNALKVLLRKG